MRVPLLAAATCALIACVPWTASAEPAGANRSNAAASATTRGLRVYVDPQTGEFATPPPGTPPPSQARFRHGVASPPTPLEEEPAPGGGFMIDIRGAFAANAATRPPEHPTLEDRE